MPRKNMTDEQCARCERHLAEQNTNPDRLCGYCQNDLVAHDLKSQRLAQWRANPTRITRYGVVPAAPATPATTFREVPTYQLVAAMRELKRRKAEALAVIKALKGV